MNGLSICVHFSSVILPIMQTRSSNKNAHPGLVGENAQPCHKKVIREPSIASTASDGSDSEFTVKKGPGLAPIIPMSFTPKQKASQSMGKSGYVVWIRYYIIMISHW